MENAYRNRIFFRKDTEYRFSNLFSNSGKPLHHAEIRWEKNLAAQKGKRQLLLYMLKTDSIGGNM
jgi:hypothetical protein